MYRIVCIWNSFFNIINTDYESYIPPISKSKIQNSYTRGDFGLGGIGFYHIFEIYQHKSTNNLTVIISEGNSPC